jgi:hypothetical protein
MTLSTKRKTRSSSHNGSALSVTSIRMISILNILDRKHTVVRMVKPKCILQLCRRKCFYSGLHMALECRDTKIWSISGCITMLSNKNAKPQHYKAPFILFWERIPITILHNFQQVLV